MVSGLRITFEPNKTPPHFTKEYYRFKKALECGMTGYTNYILLLHLLFCKKSQFLIHNNNNNDEK